VIELAADLLLALEDRPAADAAGKDRKRHLDRHEPPLILQILGAKDGRHPAAAYLFHQQKTIVEDPTGVHPAVDCTPGATRKPASLRGRHPQHRAGCGFRPIGVRAVCTPGALLSRFVTACGK
jgi:hypothetical protein